MTAVPDSPAARADRLLRDVLGDQQYEQLRTVGYIDLPSGRCRGRVYRLDNLGNLSYRDPGERTFSSALCVQPAEAVPRDDQIVMRYLLVTADEERLLKVANPITFGFISLTRALQHDFSQRYAAGPSWALTLFVIAFFLGSVGVEVWAATRLLPQHAGWAVLVLILFIVPALVGLALIIAAFAEAGRTLRTWRARRRVGDGVRA